MSDKKRFIITYHLCNAAFEQCSEEMVAEHDSINEWMREMRNNPDVVEFFIDKVFNTKMQEYCF